MLKKLAVSCAVMIGFTLSGALWAHGGKPHYMGEVTAVDATHIELKLQDGKAFSAKLDKDTKVFNGDAPAALADVKVGGRAVLHLSGEGKALVVREIHIGEKHAASEASGEAAHAERQTVAISVTEQGFTPSNAKVKMGEPISLVITRKTDQTCAKEIRIPDYGVTRELPLNSPVTITLTPKKSGEIKYTCGMGMLGGVISVGE